MKIQPLHNYLRVEVDNATVYMLKDAVALLDRMEPEDLAAQLQFMPDLLALLKIASRVTIRQRLRLWWYLRRHRPWLLKKSEGRRMRFISGTTTFKTPKGAA